MKLLVVSESYWPNLDGGAVFQRRLALGMAGLGYQVAVWAPGNRMAAYEEADGPTRILREASVPLPWDRRYRFSLWPFGRAYRILRRERPDVVHVHTPFQSGLAALLAARKLGIPAVATNHVMPENMLPAGLPRPISSALSGALWKAISTAHGLADYVTTPSDAALGFLREAGLKKPAQVVSNGLEFAPFEGGKLQGVDVPTLLYVGRHDKEKNLFTLLEGAAVLKRSAVFRLEMIGSGAKLEALKAYSRRLGLGNTVEFKGRVSEDDKVRAYRSADVFVIMSTAELQSIVTMEAMAASLPVVAADAGALPDLVINGKNGYLVPPHDPAALARSCAELIASPQLRLRMGSAGAARIKSEHSAEAMLAGYDTIYRRLMRARRR